MNAIQTTLALGLPGGWEWILVALFGLLLFGKRLPEVGRSLGKSIVEFKKGLKGVQDEIDRASEDDDQADMLPPPSSETPSSTTAQSTTAQKEKEAVS